jgi:hypothetical protein
VRLFPKLSILASATIAASALLTIFALNSDHQIPFTHADQEYRTTAIVNSSSVNSSTNLNQTNNSSPEVALSLYVHRIDGFPINASYAHYKVISNQTLQKYPILLNAIANASKIKYGYFYSPRIDFVQGKRMVTDLELNSSSLNANATAVFTTNMIVNNGKAYDIQVESPAVLAVYKVNSFPPWYSVESIPDGALSKYPTLLQAIDSVTSSNNNNTKKNTEGDAVIVLPIDIHEAISAIEDFHFAGIPTSQESPEIVVAIPSSIIMLTPLQSNISSYQDGSALS